MFVRFLFLHLSLTLASHTSLTLVELQQVVSLFCLLRWEAAVETVVMAVTLCLVLWENLTSLSVSFLRPAERVLPKHQPPCVPPSHCFLWCASLTVALYLPLLTSFFLPCLLFSLSFISYSWYFSFFLSILTLNPTLPDMVLITVRFVSTNQRLVMSMRWH